MLLSAGDALFTLKTKSGYAHTVSAYRFEKGMDLIQLKIYNIFFHLLDISFLNISYLFSRGAYPLIKFIKYFRFLAKYDSSGSSPLSLRQNRSTLMLGINSLIMSGKLMLNYCGN